MLLVQLVKVDQAQGWRALASGISRLNTLRPRQNGRQFPDNIFKCIFLNINIWISIKISLNLVPKGSINNIAALIQTVAWRRPRDKPLPESMMVSLLMYICVTRPQWGNLDCMWLGEITRNLSEIVQLRNIYWIHFANMINKTLLSMCLKCVLVSWWSRYRWLSARRQ